MFLLLAACSTATDKDPVDLQIRDALCLALQREVEVEVQALPAGSNGPQVYTPDAHQSITLTSQGEGLHTGSLGLMPPDPGQYLLAFGAEASVLFRPEFSEPFEGLELSPGCPEVAQLLQVDLSEPTTLQISDVLDPVISMAILP